MSTLEPVSFSLWRRQPKAFAEAFGRSMQQTGFAVVSDHPMDQRRLDDGLAAARRFFALPDDVKRRYIDPAGGGQRGYTPFAVETAKNANMPDLKEFWHVGRETGPDHPFRADMPPNFSVAELPEWDRTTTAMFDELDAFGMTLLEAVALFLAVDRDQLVTSVAGGNSVLRFLHYPPQTTPPPAGSVRAGAHEDINVLTLLLGAEEGGLQALTRDGEWLDVNPPAGSLVVNVGDMLERLTNRVLPSTTHRVVNPSPERARFPRYSTPFFLHFRPDFEIRTLPSCVTPDRPDAFPTPISAREFLFQRLKEIGLL
ncbi:isopenicillin N synthase family oxygenase [bacterium]|nr:isopenicillin N synthase family oxygenase [bacterium]